MLIKDKAQHKIFVLVIVCQKIMYQMHVKTVGSVEFFFYLNRLVWMLH